MTAGRRTPHLLLACLGLSLFACAGQAPETEVVEDESDLRGAACKSFRDAVYEAQTAVRDQCAPERRRFDEVLDAVGVYSLDEGRAVLQGGKVYLSTSEVSDAKSNFERVAVACATTTAGKAAAKKVRALRDTVLATNFASKLTTRNFRCATSTTAAKMFDAGVFTERELRLDDTATKTLRTKLVSDEDSLWQDTALEGPYSLEGELSIETMKAYEKDGKVFAYEVSFVAKAVFTESEGCRYSERTGRYGARCERGSLRRTAPFFPDGTEIELGNIAEFE